MNVDAAAEKSVGGGTVVTPPSLSLHPDDVKKRVISDTMDTLIAKLKPKKAAPGYKGTPNQGYKGVGPRGDRGAGDRGAGDGRSPRLSQSAAGSTKGVVGSSEAAEAAAHEAAARHI